MKQFDTTKFNLFIFVVIYYDFELNRQIQAVECLNSAHLNENLLPHIFLSILNVYRALDTLG